MEQQTLVELGLNDKEATLYLRLLREGATTASRLAKLTGLNRTTAYLELDGLLHKGLVSYVIRDAKRYYQAANPEKLLQLLELKRKKVEAVLPALSGLHKTIERFRFEVYEGKEGVKTFYQDILKTAVHVDAFGVTGKAFDLLKFDFPHLAREAHKNGLRVRYLANASAQESLKGLPEGFAQIKFLPEKYVAGITTVIYSGKVAIQSLVEDDVYVAVIDDNALYQSYVAYFDFMWQAAQ